MKNTTYSFVMLKRLVLTGALISATCSVWAQPGGGPSPVNTAKVRVGDVAEEVRLTGSVTPRRATQLSAQVSGQVEEVLVDGGDLVESGQVLVRLDASPTERLLAEEVAELHRVQAMLDELLAGSRQEDIDVERARLQEAEARVALAKAEQSRIAQLFDTKTVSQSQLDRTNAELQSAEAERTRQEAVLSRAEAGPRPEEIAAARAEVESAQARVDKFRDDIEKHSIRSPFDGVIGVKMTEIGQWVGQGDAVMAISELGTLRVVASLPEAYFNQVRPGNQATVEFDVPGAEPRTAPVSALIPRANPATRNFPIHIDVPNKNQQIAPGMLARVRVELRSLGEQKQSAIIPRDAVVLSPDGTETVWVVNEGENGLEAQPVNVKTGRVFAGEVEIVNGDLEEGDEVVTRGNELLRPGQAVSVSNSGGEQEAM